MRALVFPSVLPVLPLRNSVLFPGAVVPVNVSRPRSVRLVESLPHGERPVILVVAQRAPQVDDPRLEDVHEIGTVARLLQVVRLSSDHYSIVLQGISRARLLGPAERHPYLRARVELVEAPPDPSSADPGLVERLHEAIRRLAEVLPPPSSDALKPLEQVADPGALADLAATHLQTPTSVKQALLELLDPIPRARRVVELLEREVEVQRVRREVARMVQEEMSRSQREYLLRQQLRAIRRELGEGEDDEDEIEQLRDRVARADMPPEAEKAAKKQLARMRTMPASGAEYQVARNYVEWLVELPWGRGTPDRLDVAEARRVLDADHYGLEPVKRRIVEYVAVRRLRGDKKGPILCFLGPPGVGKTSLGRSIARATGRNFVRIALGGVHDEAEIRGHRRTYVGALPGRLVSALRKAGSRNPVMLLDEVDKLGRDVRGDPAAALLEALDPEQNHAFADHYIEVPVDLSQVLFVATANRRDTIPPPLLDRMEVIELPGYGRDEKLAIARGHLVPRQLEAHGLQPDRLEIPDAVLELLLDGYTREAGVRGLERQIAALCRAVAVELARGVDVRRVADEAFVGATLGAPRHEPPAAERHPVAGVATGLAWTPTGGEVLLVESTRMAGTGKIHVTGNAGEVMRESVAAAFTYLRSRAGALGLPDDFLERIDVHVHLPQAALPKDGPGHGAAIVASLASMLTRRRVRSDLALMGEITLRGAVLRVDGVRQKCLAAHRAGIRHVVLPRASEPDWEEVPEPIRATLQPHFVHHVDEVLALALMTDPVADPRAETGAAP
ncbi:MAG: endopeptidase La [Myxococcota bacterium]|nr:endopeptidase La [Myxococcota bacterium]MDW8361422.1 endopeptidase La [Myxococcales bacterium]